MTLMASQRFSAVIKLRGINPYVLVSAARARAIKPDWRKPLPVRVRVNDAPVKPVRVNMMPAGDGTFYLYLREEIRKASGTGLGDRVQVEVSFDEGYRNGPMDPMPSWFRAGLRKHRQAKAGWEALTPSRQKEILRYFAALKTDEARARNLERSLTFLSGGGRFMARDKK